MLDLVECRDLPLCIVLDSASATSALDFFISSGELEVSICSCLIFGLISSSGELDGMGDVDARLLGVETPASASGTKSHSKLLQMGKGIFTLKVILEY